MRIAERCRGNTVMEPLPIDIIKRRHRMMKSVNMQDEALPLGQPAPPLVSGIEIPGISIAIPTYHFLRRIRLRQSMEMG